ncbi:MAG: bifunctional 5,10-methylenetetrahydrofolate dehydrogenase/5,10-methenyltetrahydrofolate cyclohydrolase [Deltaproteobacteria bacterium]|nr:bifunctional 5,10-methylenetetrahydrofolate dehydrogenase/5,10-methenyltetrahydrofolate cyclohydrolase [Deltaproteobacteria bacterium]
MGQIINGKKIADGIQEEIRAITAKLPYKPRLDAILVGNNPASSVYVSMKQKACIKAGFDSKIHMLPSKTTKKKLVQLISKLNLDNKVHGILLQLPLPSHLKAFDFLKHLSPLKDVDCLTPYNMGRLFSGYYDFAPCTPLGIIKLIKSTRINLDGKHAVVVGRSLLVGKPLSLLLLEENCTVTMCHSHTKNIFDLTKQADILVAALGKPLYISPHAISKKTIIIDVGINRLPNGLLVGDVDFKKVSKKAAWITPVPGGVGPMTIAMLLQNTLLAARIQNS